MTIVRLWTAEGYHRDGAHMDEEQVRMQCSGTERRQEHSLTDPIYANRVVIDPKLFPEAVEFEVIVTMRHQ